MAGVMRRTCSSKGRSIFVHPMAGIGRHQILEDKIIIIRRDSLFQTE
jgi:hypothetical protein